MPEIKIKHVASFSSEDKVHKADNLLKSENFRKWKCATAGEKSASVVLQFEKATKIHSIDIGNESSALVEVLVGRSADSVSQYQVLLTASSFMSPQESRNETHTNRVRMFDNEKLAQNLKDEKWDCVQVVCTQPFNKNIAYGLSFIKFHSPPDKYAEQEEDKATKTSNSKAKLGAFELKYDDEDDVPSPSLGNSWLKNRNSSITNSPTSRQEPTTSKAKVSAPSIESEPENSNLCEYEKQMLKSREEHRKLLKALKIKEAMDEFSSAVKVAKERKRSPQSPIQVKPKRINIIKASAVKRSPDPKEQLNQKPVKKRELTPAATVSTPKHLNKVEKVKKQKPFGKTMDKVVFVLSGFVNPMRGELRDKAIEMGAKYKPDWDRTCTHLVCAFINTPKYVQVRGADGRVVKKEWILDCHRRKTLLPWKDYKLGTYSKASTEEESGGSDGETASPAVTKGSSKNENSSKKPRARIIFSDSDSEDEKPESTPKPKPKSLFGETTANGKNNPKKQGVFSKPDKSESETEDEEALKDYMANTDVESDSGGDTEGEIRKVEEQSKLKKSSDKTNQNVPTEDEDSESLLPSKPDTSDLPLPDLPNLFKKRHFYMYGEFSAQKRHELQRLIVAYNGLIDNYMNDAIKYVVTEKEWDKNFEDALEENEDLIFVKSEWISKCHEAQKLVPYQAYIVIPGS